MKGPRVHFFAVLDGKDMDWLACGASVETKWVVDGKLIGGVAVTRDPAGVTCRACLGSRWGPNGEAVRERSERQWENSRRRAKDRREAELAVLARHQEELEDELALRALARLGS